MRPSSNKNAFLGYLADHAGELLLAAMLIVAGLLRFEVTVSEPHRWIWPTTVSAPTYDNIAGLDR